MTDIKITITRVVPNIFTVRRWGDKQLYELDGMSTADLGYGSFQEVPLYSEKLGFNAISSFQEFKRSGGVIPELEYLESIQPNDFSDYHFTVSQKMGWLVGQQVPEHPPGTIYWSQDGAWDELTCTGFKFGTLVFGGQKVQVEADQFGKPKGYKCWAKYRNKNTMEWIPFFKLLGLRSADMGRPLADLLAEAKVQICTCANRSGAQENIYTETLRGVVYHPVWSPYEWRTSSGENALYIAQKFLEGL